MEKNKKNSDSNKEEKKNEEVKSSNIENAHASGDGSLRRDEETLMNKTTEDKTDEIKKDADQY